MSPGPGRSLQVDSKLLDKIYSDSFIISASVASQFLGKLERIDGEMVMADGRDGRDGQNDIPFPITR